ncbi:GGDEF domain-containing protein [Clostridium beijerinckii]|uniref:GGDEF domain-containing protein n=1 Tax=Clostridium beijerinckii TaxID=1520 RepID=UPI00098BFD59|nr:diguanylate cyclase [Clostridium beijerinckii]NRT76272.1 diguanylate cyclase [Clostridium beijerinckii]OOM35919.1 response regulator PleD [Clostridium beijerinckii]
MVLSFFQNACILIAFMSIGQNFFKEKNIFCNSSLNDKVAFGFFSGILGVILLMNSVQITHDTIIDFRYIPILLSALYVGLIPSVIASIIIGAFRFFFLGVSNSSIIGLICSLFIGVGFGIISLLKSSKRRKYIYSMILLIIVSVISSFIALKNVILIFQTLTMFISGYLIISYFSIKYLDYIIETIKIYQRLKNEATKDYLTGLNNVRQFDDSFNNISQLAIRKEEELSMLLIDIDYFKKVNDNYGHNSGDIILKGLAEILINTCRTYDVISRMGGEEFSIILLDCSDSRAFKIAERLRNTVQNNNFYISDNEAIKITISIGISSYPKLTSQIDNLLENADIALYQAKNIGRNKVVLFNNDKN